MPVSRAATSVEQQRRWEHARQLVGANVRRQRLAAGLTQEALALEAGLARNMLIHIEHGTRPVSYERLFDLAEALGLEVSLLLE